MVSKRKPSRHAPGEIDAYLARLPDEMRAALERVRAIIREIVPDCTERVSYQIPIFRRNRDLVGLSAQAHHCSLHSMSPPLLRRMAEELADVKVSGATIQFTPDNPLPRVLIERVVCARLAELEAC
jgi:uncharacterized protein YdhG (YjbR/CyaY superfamily)